MSKIAAVKNEKGKTRRTVLGLLAIIVIIGVTSWLTLPAITADDPHCGIDDPAHEHVLACYSDSLADVETAEVWEATLPAEGNAADIAASQIGYEESTANYMVADGDVINGYTRYGAWFGDSYADWNVPFAAFCLSYGGAAAEYMPPANDCTAWMDQLDTAGLFALEGADYVSAAGDLVFTSGSEIRAGIVAAVSEDGSQLTVIEGDSDNQVQEVIYNTGDGSVIGYGVLEGATAPEEPVSEEPAVEEEEPDDTEKQAEKPAMMMSVNRASSTAITYSDSEKTASFEPVNNSNYPASSYKLKVEKLSTSNYKDDVEKFMGLAPAEYIPYKIALVDTRNNGNQEVQNYNGNYKVELTFKNGAFANSSASDYFYLMYKYDSTLYEVTPSTIERTSEGNITKIVFEGDKYPRQNDFVLIRHTEPRMIKAGERLLKYNTVKDAFIKDPAYANYYNENSPIGTAGSFHIVAFDTAYLNSHTNGNVLAKKLEAGSNFGTNSKGSVALDELSYVQEYVKVQASSASETKHILALGSECNIELMDNGNAIGINGTKIDKPYNYICDIDTETAPFIDLVRVENEIRAISQELNNFADGGVTIKKFDQYGEVRLNDSSGLGVVHMTVDELMEKSTGSKAIRMEGFSEGVMGTIIMNIDCTGETEFTLPTAYIYVDGVAESTAEVVEFSAGKVIWNFVNAEGVKINTYLMTGMVVAPGAYVEITQNLNGTVVAENIKVSAESHRTDFTGTVVEVKTNSVMVKKIKTGYVGTSLSGAEFDLYKWSNGNWQKVNTSKLVTNSSGYVELEYLDKSVAYKLVETKAPAGYVKNEEPYYFWVKGSATQTSPNTKPSNFTGSAVDAGGMMMAANEPSDVQEPQLTDKDLHIEKAWHNSSGSPMEEPPVDSIEVDVLQTTNGDEGTRIVWQTVVLTKRNGWSATVKNAPASETASDGTAKVYTYEVVEKNVPEGYEVTSSTVNGDNEITINITNTKVASGYELPDAGGMGTTIFTITGAFLMLLAIALLYRRRDK